MGHARRSVFPAAVAGAALTLLTTACGADGGSSAGGSAAASPSPTLTATASPSASATTAEVEKETEDLDRSNFSRSTVVDNTWFPLTPGKQLTYRGVSNVDGERLTHDVVMTVTDLVKEIDGVRSRTIYELDFTEGTLNEAELAFFAQDDDGTVWHVGQYPEEYEDGKFVASPTWVAGQEEAKAGIFMKADPQLGKPSYAQGWGPAVDWKDRARVVKTGEKSCVAAGCYSDLLVTEEFARADPDAFQLKYYAAGVGNVRVGWAGAKETEREELELVSVKTLDDAALAKIHRDALALEKHAYEVSKDVYGTTKPLEPASGT